MNKFHRILALTAIAAIPTAAAAAQSSGPYSPYQPTTPPATTPGSPGNPFEEPVKPLTPSQIAGNLRDDVEETLENSLTAKDLLKKKPVQLTIGVTGAGRYSVELSRKAVVRSGKKGKRIIYRRVASGSVTAPTNAVGTKKIKLTLTKYGRSVLRAAKGETVKLKLRTGFKPRAAKRTTWSNRINVSMAVKELSEDNAQNGKLKTPVEKKSSKK